VPGSTLGNEIDDAGFARRFSESSEPDMRTRNPILDLEHLPVLGGVAGGEPVADRLVCDGPEQDRGHLVEAPAPPQGRPDVDLVVVQEAEVEPAVGGEAQAVAGAAVGLGDGADEPDDAERAGEL
jgi:hypothetical protein